jgi:hypothetical protein
MHDLNIRKETGGLGEVDVSAGSAQQHLHPLGGRHENLQHAGEARHGRVVHGSSESTSRSLLLTSIILNKEH